MFTLEFSADAVDQVIKPEMNEIIHEERLMDIAPDIHFIGAFKNAYLLVESGENLLLIDQHAAHERIIFDRLLANYNARKPRSQGLLMPEIIKVTDEEYLLLKNNQTVLFDLGFCFTLEEHLLVSVSAVPSDLTDLSLDAMLDDIYTAFGERDAKPNRGCDYEIV